MALNEALIYNEATMVNLSLITNSINTVVCLFIFAKVYKVYRASRKKATADPLLDFSIFYLLLGLYFANVAIFLDAIHVWYIMSLVHITLISSAAYMLAVSFGLYGLVQARRILIVSFVFIGVLATIADIYFGLQTMREPIIKEVSPGFLVVKADFPAFLRILDGLFTLGGGSFSSVFFFLHARSVLDPVTKKRSRIIGTGLASITAASMLAFLFGASNSVLVIIIASSTAVPALLIILWGVLYRYRELAPNNTQSPATTTAA